MNKRNFWIVVMLGAGLAGAAPLAQADITDALLARVGEFKLDNGETKTVIRKNEPKQYRVCMTDRPEAVPLKVTYDGKEAIVAPGECHLLEARNIKLATAARLGEDMTLIGRINRRETKTSVSVARAVARSE